MISPRLCKAARALLGWTQVDLAEKAGVALDVVRRFERGVSDTRGKALIAMEAALRRGGVKLIPPDDREGEGVRISSTKT